MYWVLFGRIFLLHLFNTFFFRFKRVVLFFFSLFASSHQFSEIGGFQDDMWSRETRSFSLHSVEGECSLKLLEGVRPEEHKLKGSYQLNCQQVILVILKMLGCALSRNKRTWSFLLFSLMPSFKRYIQTFQCFYRPSHCYKAAPRSSSKSVNRLEAISGPNTPLASDSTRHFCTIKAAAILHVEYSTVLRCRRCCCCYGWAATIGARKCLLTHR